MYKLKLLSDDEKRKISKGVVTYSNTRDPQASEKPSLISSEIFGRNYKVKLGVTTRHKDFGMGTIELPIYTFNYGVTGANPLYFLNKFLYAPHLYINFDTHKEKALRLDGLVNYTEAVRKDEIERINREGKQRKEQLKDFNQGRIKMTWGVSPLRLEPIDSIDGECFDDYYFGAEAIMEIVKYASIFEDYINDKCVRSWTKAQIKEPTDYKPGDHVLDLIGGKITTAGSEHEIAERKLHYIQKANPRSPIPFVFNGIRYDELMKVFQKVILVAPTGIRPMNNNTQSPLTVLYERIINASNNLQAEISSANKNMDVLKRKMDILDKCVKSLYIQYVPTNNSERKYIERYSRESIKERLASKEGHIRQRCLSKRKDYSGRSAITVNGDLRIDQVGIPIEMLKRLYAYHIIRAKGITDISDFDALTDDEVIEIMNTPSTLYQNQSILEYVPICINRAPTLHKLGYLAFYVVPTSGRSIEFCPLVCSGYNADFDGDQVAAHVPIGDAAIKDAKELMLASKNIYVPASGEHTNAPAHEILFGLNQATRDYEDKGVHKVYKSVVEVYNDVYMHKLKVYDRVTVPGVATNEIAGRTAFRHCLPANLRNMELKPITKKTIKSLMDLIAREGEHAFVKTMHSLVVYGFRVSEIYSLSVSIIKPYTNLQQNNNKYFAEFDKNMSRVVDGFVRGYEDSTSYMNKFNKEFDAVMNKIAENVDEEVGEDNGYLQYVKSGARGSMSNITQIYYTKGKISRKDTGAFRVIFKSSFCDQLKPIEHFANAYASRVGVMDRSQETSTTGYLNRQMYQGAADVIIRSEDCGTTEGLTVDKQLIGNSLPMTGDQREAEIQSTVIDILVGRYLIDDGNLANADPAVMSKLRSKDMYVTKEVAKELAKDKNVSKITMRSPMFCKDQCCSKCYGDHLAIRGKAVIGTPVGIEAGESIGEPMTQLTMRTFQSGGVAGKESVVSDLSRMNNFVKASDVSNSPSYDPIAWKTGRVIVTKDKDKYVVQIEGSKKKLVLTNLPELKDNVVIGKGMCIVQGDFDVREMLAYAGEHDAKSYLPIAMYLTYRGKASVNIKHFETLCSEMFQYYIIEPGKLTQGLTYSYRDVCKTAQKRHCVLYSAIDSNIKSDSNLSSIVMERLVDGLQHAIFAETNKMSEEPIMVQMMMGDKVNVASKYNPSYYAERSRNANTKIH